MTAAERRRLGAWLKRRRVERDMTVRELAARLRCGTNAVYYVERGAHAPGFTLFAKWLRVLNVDLLRAIGA